MIYIQEPMNRAIPDALMSGLAQSVPAGTDMWRQVQSRLATYDPSIGERKLVRAVRIRRMGVAGITCALLTVGGLTVSSTTASHVEKPLTDVQSNIGIAVAPNGSFESLHPDPPFTVVSPSSMPSVLTQTEFTYNNNVTMPNRGVRASLTSFPLSNPYGQDVIDSEKLSTYVWLVYANSSGSQEIEVLEQSMSSGQSLPTGQTVTIAGAKGTMHRDGAFTVIDYLRGAARISVFSNLDQAETRSIVDSIK